MLEKDLKWDEDRIDLVDILFVLNRARLLERNEVLLVSIESVFLTILNLFLSLSLVKSWYESSISSATSSDFKTCFCDDTIPQNLDYFSK